MKKVLKLLSLGLCGALVFSAAAGFSACGKENGTGADKVYLKAVDPANVAQAVTTMQADYFLLAEPAVTAQSKNGFAIKGDLQALYGGENGYPQAVLVAKTELLASNAGWVENFALSITQAAAWLETASGADVVSAVSAHVDDEKYATTLKAPLLSADAMGRCGVRFTSAMDSKAETTAFLQEMLAVNDKATVMPTDEFFWAGAEQGSAVNPPEKEVSVYMPDGAPALALAKLMSEDTADDGVTYKVVAPNLIASKVNYQDESKNADLCVMPVTAASKLLGQGNRYKMVGVVTHGNLFLISKTGEALTVENISDLKGKTVGVLNINEVPGLTFKVVLNKYNIPFEEV